MADITELAQSLKAAAEKWSVADEKYDRAEINAAEFVSAADQYNSIVRDPANILALLEELEKSESRLHEVAVACATAEQALEKAQATEAHCNRGWREAHEQEARAEAAEKRIADLESRTVKLPPKIERDDADGWFVHKGGRVGGGAAEWYNKALDDVGAELTATGIKWEAE